MTPPSSTPCREGNEAGVLDSLAERCERLERALQLMPDEIEVFRLMRLGGRNRADQARVVASRIESIRKATQPPPLSDEGD